MEGKMTIGYQMKLLVIMACLISFSNASEDYLSLRFDSCVLKIPVRYSHVLLHSPTTVNPTGISFARPEVKDEVTQDDKVKNLLLVHEINVRIGKDKNWNKHIEILKKGKNYDIIDMRHIGDLQIYRFKNKPYDDIENPTETQIEHIKMFNSRNMFYIQGKDFYIVAEETDEYANEIYKMVEDCGKIEHRGQVMLMLLQATLCYTPPNAMQPKGALPCPDAHA